MIDNEKPLVLTERELKQLVEVIVDNKFLEYIDYFRAEQEKSIQMTQQNQEYREQQVKQAKIDVLNELKEKKSIDKPHANIEALKASLSQSGPTYSPERPQADIRSLSSTMTIWDIDEMIEEIENDRIR